MGIREKILWQAVKRRVSTDRPFIIAIGGGIAKTTTKIMLGEVMKAAYPGQVLVGYGNLNTFIGVPLAVLGFRIDFHKKPPGAFSWLIILLTAIWRGYVGKLKSYLVLEYGTDSPGDVKALVDQLAPNMALLTLVTEAHVANYPSMEDVANDEAQLIMAVGADGKVLINKADKYVDKFLKDVRAKVITVDTPPETIARNFSITAAKELGIDQSVIDTAINKPLPPNQRFEIKRLADYYLIDDSYNANPASMEAALNVLAKSPGRKVAVIGDMLELGEQEVTLHQQVGLKAKQVADLVVGVGELAKNYQADHWYPDSNQAAQAIFSHLEKGDSILVKASRGIRMEKISNQIKNHGI